MNRHADPINIETARLHLRVISGEADPAVSWQTFNDADKNSRRDARSFHGRLDEVLQKLRAAQKQGCGVFVAVNKTDGEGRKKSNMVAAANVLLDLDGQPLPDKFPVSPALITQTSAGKFHCWWPIEPTDDWQAWQAFHKQLIVEFGGDPKCAMITQVGRVAGFQHQKDPDNVQPVEIYEDNSADYDRGLTWTLDDLAKEFGYDLDALSAEPARDRIKEPEHGWDHAADVARARDFVSREQNWHKTSNGEVSVFRAAAHLQDLGISPELAVELITEHVPMLPDSWPDDHIETKVNHAYTYAQGDAGNRSVMTDFADGFDPEAEQDGKFEELFARDIAFIGHREPATVPLTPWLVPGLLLFRDIALIAGMGGVGKSLLAWQICVAVIMGRAFGPWPAPQRPRRVLVLSGEDDFDEIERRVIAGCQSMGVDRSDLGDDFMVLNRREIRLAINDPKTGKVKRTDLWQFVRRVIQEYDVGVLIIDPLMKSSAGFDESSSNDQDRLFEEIRALTEGVQCAVLLEDHMNKMGVGGAQASVRGSSAKVDAARVAITFSRMTEKEHAEIKPPHRREAYVRLSDPKQNYARVRGDMWFELVEYELGNGEVRPALVPRDFEVMKDFMDPDSWEHRDAFMALVKAGRTDPAQQGWPWCVTTKGQRSTRLDVAVAEAFDLTEEQAREWIRAFEADKLIDHEMWTSPSRNQSKVWRAYE